MSELKPCPFCGSDDVFTTCADEKFPEWNVMCRKCCSSCHWVQNESEAIASWNRRSDPAPTGGESVESRLAYSNSFKCGIVTVPIEWDGHRVRVTLID